MSMEDRQTPLALVTGASSGLGAAFAERLAGDGFDLIITARRKDRLDALKQRLAGTDRRIEILAADLSDGAGLQAVVDRIRSEPTLEMLVNNAGFAGYMPFIQLTPERARELVNLQVMAVVQLTHAALPGMIARGRGSIINVSSRLAFSGSLGSQNFPKRAVYAGSKAFINTFTQLLHSELEGTGVRVQALCPGLVNTEFHAAAGVDSGRFPPAAVSSPEDIVTASLAGLELGEPVCIPTMEDPSLLSAIEAGQKHFFENTRGGQIASRYRK